MQNQSINKNNKNNYDDLSPLESNYLSENSHQS